MRSRSVSRTTAGALAAAETERDALEQQLARAESEIETLEGATPISSRRWTPSQEASARLQAEVSALTAEQDALAGQLAALRADHEALQTEALRRAISSRRRRPRSRDWRRRASACAGRWPSWRPSARS